MLPETKKQGIQNFHKLSNPLLCLHLRALDFFIHVFVHHCHHLTRTPINIDVTLN